jgi:hypothetical protein
MSLGRHHIYLLLLSFCCAFSVSCNKTEKKSNPSPSAIIEKNLVSDIPRQLSGVWYRSLNQAISKSRTVTFSWGKVTFDYWTALCIDIPNNKGFLQFKDGEFELEKPSIEKANLVSFQASDPGSPYVMKMLFQFENDGSITLSFADGPGTGYMQDLSGKYYRKEGP